MDFPPTITEAAAAMRSGKLTSVSVVAQCLARIDRYEEKIHAWVLVDRHAALKAAAAADRELASGNDRGPLHGIPIGIKDIIDVKGLPTRCGSPLTSTEPTERDAPVVARLREAGAIVLGKTVTCEWACFDPSPTRNPWNLERSPGGSSSGSAAAVAAGMCLGAIGTQTGGSVIRPASYCGIGGLKMSWCGGGNGIASVASSFDSLGVMAKSIGDLILLYGGMGGEEWTGVPSLQGNRSPWSSSLESLMSKKIFRLRGFFEDEADAVVQKAVDSAVSRLQQAGAQVEEATLSDDVANSALTFHHDKMCMSLALEHQSRFEADAAAYGPKISSLISHGWRQIQARKLATSWHEAGLEMDYATEKHLQNLLAGGVLILPSVSAVAPTLKSTGDSRFQAIWSAIGVPALTLPIARSDDGLPIGLQFVGRVSSEHELLQTALWCERVLAFEQQPPLD